LRVEREGYKKMASQLGIDNLRFAGITTENAERDRQSIASFLPANYEVVGVLDVSDFPEVYGDSLILIGGIDRAGWTLDDYVLPRLASGLYFGDEIK